MIYLLELTCANTNVAHITTPHAGVDRVEEHSFFREFIGDSHTACYNKADANGWRINRMANIAVCPPCSTAGVSPIAIMIGRMFSRYDHITSVVMTPLTRRRHDPTTLLKDRQMIVRHFVLQDQTIVSGVLVVPDAYATDQLAKVLAHVITCERIKTDVSAGPYTRFHISMARDQINGFAECLVAMGGSISTEMSR